jgi:hypothetical protein
MRSPHSTPSAGTAGLQHDRPKIDWSLSPTERELLRRDYEASKVPIAVQDPNAIKRIVRLITKADDRRDAA